MRVLPIHLEGSASADVGGYTTLRKHFPQGFPWTLSSRFMTGPKVSTDLGPSRSNSSAEIYDSPLLPGNRPRPKHPHRRDGRWVRCLLRPAALLLAKNRWQDCSPGQPV